jgi:hypothetical protein
VFVFVFKVLLAQRGAHVVIGCHEAAPGEAGGQAALRAAPPPNAAADDDDEFGDAPDDDFGAAALAVCLRREAAGEKRLWVRGPQQPLR